MSYLRILALIAAAAFAAIAIYISAVEQPARLALEARAQLIQWSSSFSGAMKIQGSLAILSGVAGGCLWWRSRNLFWLLGAALAFANWPFTLIWLSPINGTLLATAPDRAGAVAQSLIAKWGDLHLVRGVIGSLVVGCFAVAASRPVPPAADHAK